MTSSRSELAAAFSGTAAAVPPVDLLAQSLLLGGIASVIWSIDHEISLTTPAFREMLGIDSASLTHESFLACVHADDRRSVARTQADLLTAGGSYEYQFRIMRPDDSIRWLLARGGALVDTTGGITGFAGVNLDITDQKLAELAAVEIDAKLRRKSEELWAILDTMPQIAWSALPSGFHDFYNRRWYDFTGVAPGSTDGTVWSELFHPDDRSFALRKWQHSVETGEPYEVEYRLRQYDGSYHWTLCRAMPLRNADGEIERWFGTCTDIERLKAAEDQISLTAGELSHRIKNIFAVVGSLINLAARAQPAAQPFADAMCSRLTALAIAHDHIRGSGAAPTSLKLLLAELVKPYVEQDIPRVVVSGDDISFGPGAATAVALVIHELATNSMKYGALSADAGRVTVTASVGEDMVLISWTEQGGPPVTGPPIALGFGTGLAERALKAQLKASLHYRWQPSGLGVTITAPRANLAL